MHNIKIMYSELNLNNFKAHNIEIEFFSVLGGITIFRFLLKVLYNIKINI